MAGLQLPRHYSIRPLRTLRDRSRRGQCCSLGVRHRGVHCRSLVGRQRASSLAALRMRVAPESRMECVVPVPAP